MLVLFVAMAGSLLARADDGTTVYKNGMKSAVMIFAPGKIEGNLVSGSQGSGSVVNLSQGYILTNWHVVHSALKGADVFVHFPKWAKNRPVGEKDQYPLLEGLPAKVVAMEEKVDLAILKILQPARIPRGVASVRFPSDSPLAGAKVHSIGNPGVSGSMWVYTPGEVRSVYNKSWRVAVSQTEVAEFEVKIIEATSPTAKGDSGGPCFNDKGEQIGVTQGGIPGAANYAYFIDSSAVKTFLTKNKVKYNVNDPPPDDSSPTVAVKDTEPKKKEAEPKKEVTAADAAAEELAKQEKKAASELNFLRTLAKDPNKKTFASEQLQKFIGKYPKTEAAKEAKALLKQIQ